MPLTSRMFFNRLINACVPLPPSSVQYSLQYASTTQNKSRPQSDLHLGLLVLEHPTFHNMHQPESNTFSVSNHQLALVNIH